MSDLTSSKVNPLDCDPSANTMDQTFNCSSELNMDNSDELFIESTSGTKEKISIQPTDEITAHWSEEPSHLILQMGHAIMLQDLSIFQECIAARFRQRCLQKLKPYKEKN